MKNKKNTNLKSTEGFLKVMKNNRITVIFGVILLSFFAVFSVTMQSHIEVAPLAENEIPAPSVATVLIISLQSNSRAHPRAENKHGQEKALDSQ